MKYLDVASIILLLFIIYKFKKIMSTQQELTEQIKGVTAIVQKIGTESTKTLEKVAALEEAINNQSGVSPELQSAFDDLKAQVTTVDDLIADAPIEPTPAPIEETPTPTDEEPVP